MIYLDQKAHPQLSKSYPLFDVWCPCERCLLGSYDQESIKEAYFFSLNSDEESQRRFLDDIYETLIEYIDVSFSRF